VNIIAYSGGSKFEPVADANINFQGHGITLSYLLFFFLLSNVICAGVFSYYFYNTLQTNTTVANLSLIDSVQDSVKVLSNVALPCYFPNFFILFF
jgi:hypothetical protein